MSASPLPAPAAFWGAGPGAQTADGCSVVLYSAMPYAGDLDDILDALPAGATLLELGCGTGRHTRALLARGLAVTAVDNSSAMLAALPAPATPVLSDIGALALPARFDIALLASNLINHGDPAVRAAFLAAARSHLRPGGRLLAQRHDPTWLRTATVGSGARTDGLAIVVEQVERTGDRVAMALRYELADGRRWQHGFVVEALDEPAVEAALAAAGFTQWRWLGARRRWVEAGGVMA